MLWDLLLALSGITVRSITTSRCRPPIAFARTTQMSTVVLLLSPSWTTMLVSLRETVAPAMSVGYKTIHKQKTRLGKKKKKNCGMKLVLTIIINYGDSNCASTSQNHVQRVCWSYHQLECLIPLHEIISHNVYGCHTDSLALYSCGRNHHLHFQQHEVCCIWGICKNQSTMWSLVQQCLWSLFYQNEFKKPLLHSLKCSQ